MGQRRPLGVQDTFWLEMDRPNNLMVVDSVIWTAEPLDWDRVREVYAERLVGRYPVFHSRAVKDDGSWWWEEYEQFSFDDHVTHVTLDDPDDPRALQQLVAEHRTVPLDRDKPLWYLLWVDRYLDGSAIIMRSHHAIADGIRMVELAMTLFDGSADGDSVLVPAVITKRVRPEEPRKSRMERLRAAGLEVRAHAGGIGQVATDAGRGARELATRVPAAVGEAGALARALNVVGAGHTLASESASLTREAASAARTSIEAAFPRGGSVLNVFSVAPAELDAVRKLVLGTRNDPTLWTGTASTEKGVAWADPLPLASIREVAKSNQATINDVLSTCLALTLHEYLTSHRAHCGSVTFMVPMNLKPLNPSLPDELGNGFALVELELPTDEPDPMRVLSVVKRRMARIKHGHEAVIDFRVQEGFSHLSHRLYEMVVDLFANRNAGVLTNVPGPPMPVYMAGSRVEGIVGWAPVSGDQPMSVTIYSYDGRVVIGIACDRVLVPDYESIVDGFASAFAELRSRSGL